MIERPRWAWEELQPGDLIQDKDEWQNEDGRWHPLVMVPGASTQLRDGLRARRPHNITALQKERDEARAQGAKLSAELWARKPLEDRVAALTDEVTQLRVERQEWIDWYDAKGVNALQVSEQLTAAKDALKTAQRARDELQLQVDDLRAGLMGVVSAQHVHSMLEDMLDQTEWVGQCLDSSTFEQMSCIQRTISVIAERVSDMGKEVASADA